MLIGKLKITEVEFAQENIVPKVLICRKYEIGPQTICFELGTSVVRQRGSFSFT